MFYAYQIWIFWGDLKTFTHCCVPFMLAELVTGKVSLREGDDWCALMV